MVNLLGRRGGSTAAPGFDRAQADRIEARLRDLFTLAVGDRLPGIDPLASDLEAELEELDATSSPVAAEGLIAALDRLRQSACAQASRDALDPNPWVDSSSRALPGDFVCHRPGRSLGTGEAEIASRGFFDVWDRPPLVTWIGVLQGTPESVADGLWIVAWVGVEALEAARAGCRACPNGALAHIDDVSASAAEQLRAAACAVLGAEDR
ncbi:hypothetical protein K2X89_06120 [Myxococcota bacterium]|nr:hypothetical protein [Myxococcota bacterium]